MTEPIGKVTGELVIRADAGIRIGTGHVMRCLALAQAWRDAGGRVICITSCSIKALLKRLQEERFTLHLLDNSWPDAGDWNSTGGILREYPGAWVVLDGYHFTTEYQIKIRGAGYGVLVIDDMAHLSHYAADILLNQNLHAEELVYSVAPGTRLLLGTQYALLRREFLVWQGWQREIPPLAKHVLVTLGGADKGNATMEIIRALEKTEVTGLEVTVIIGAGNPHAEMINKKAEESVFPLRVLHDVTSMPELMAWADVAISAAGSTVWELMFLGVPTVLVSIADNQDMIAESASAARASVAGGIKGENAVAALTGSIRELIRDAPKRAQLSQQGRRLVDGLGAERVVAALAQKPVGRL